MKLTLYLACLAVVNIAISLVAHWYVLVTIGPGVETDAFFAGLAVPQLVLAVVSGSLAHVLVPVLAGLSSAELRRTAWTFVVLVGAAFAVLSIVLVVAAGAWVPVLFPGFSDRGKVLTVGLTRIQTVGMVFTALIGVLAAAYRAQQRFAWAEASGGIAGMLAIGALVWSLPKYGILAAAWAAALRPVIQAMLLLPVLGPYNAPTIRDPAIRVAWSRLKALLAGTSYYKAGPLVDRVLSSLAPAGGLSVYYIAQQAYSVGGQMVNQAIATPMVPRLARQAIDGTWTAFRHTYEGRLVWVTSLSVGALVLLLLVGNPALDLLVGYGGVTAADVRLLWLTMLALGGVGVGGAAGQILASSFYAKGNTVTPTTIGVIGFTLGIGLKVLGFLSHGLLGLAAAASVYHVLNAAALQVTLKRELRRS